MPNWCENIVKFTGDKNKITKLADRLTKPVKVVRQGSLAVLSYDQPPWEYGEEFKSDIPPGGHAMARTVVGVNKDAADYNWMVDVMGTKWDFNLENINVTDTQITGYASTAWSPPEGWFRKVCEKYGVTGELRSGESGNEFGCILSIDNEGENHYSSSFSEFECLNYDSKEEYLEVLLDDQEDYPEFVESIKNQARTWPETWSQYKQRFKD